LHVSPRKEKRWDRDPHSGHYSRPNDALFLLLYGTVFHYKRPQYLTLPSIYYTRGKEGKEKETKERKERKEKPLKRVNARGGYQMVSSA